MFAKNKMLGRWIRWNRLCFAIVTGTLAAWVYCTSYLEDAARQTLEQWATSLRGASVSIQNLSLSFPKGEFELNQLEVSRKSFQDKNLLSIDKISGKFDLSALLRKKVHLTTVTIEGIRHNNKRVRIAETSSDTPVPTDENSLAQEATKGLYGDLRKDIGQNPISYLSKLNSSVTVTDKLTLNVSQLKSLQEIRRLKDLVAELLKKWEPVAARLSDLSAVEVLKQRWSSVSIAHKRALASKTPSPDVRALLAEIDSRLKEIEAHRLTFTDETAPIESAIRNFDKLASLDLATLHEKVGFPQLNVEDLSSVLMGPKFLDYFARYLTMVEWSRNHMPIGTATLVERKLEHGMSIHFGRLDALPTFLVEKTTVYSKLGVAQGGGDVQGVIEGFSSDPSILKKSLRIEVTADFPSLNISQTKLTVVVDHTGRVPKETFSFSAREFPIHDWIMNDSPLLKLHLQEAVLGGEFKAELEGDHLNAHGMASVNQSRYEVKSSIASLETKLHDAILALLNFDVRARITGTLLEPDVQISSDFGKVVSSHVHGAFHEEISTLDESLKRHLARALTPEHNELDDRYQQFHERIWPIIETRYKALQELKEQADKSMKRPAKKS